MKPKQRQSHSLRNNFLLPCGAEKGTELRNHRCPPKLSSDGGGGREGVLGLRSKGWGLSPLPALVPCQEQLVPCLGTSPSKQLLTPSPQLCRGTDMYPQLVQKWMCQTRKCPKCLAAHSPFYLPHLRAVGSLPLAGSRAEGLWATNLLQPHAQEMHPCSDS